MLRKKFGRAAGLAAGFALAAAIGVLAAILYQSTLSTTINVIGAQVDAYAMYVDDNGVEELPAFDDGDIVGAGDPTTIGPNATRNGSDIGSCTAVNNGGGSFTVTLDQSFEGYWCNFSLGLDNQSTDLSMVYQSLSSSIDPTVAEVQPITAYGETWAPLEGKHLQFGLHVLPGAVAGSYAGDIVVELEAQ